MKNDWDEQGREAAIMMLIVDEMKPLRLSPLKLPLPQDRRARRVCLDILDNPGAGRTLAEYGRLVGASARTLERLFRVETQQNFGSWRQNARLLAALEQLAAGAAISNVALDLGYGSASAFTSMFKRALGTVPSRYFERTKC